MQTRKVNGKRTKVVYSSVTLSAGSYGTISELIKELQAVQATLIDDGTVEIEEYYDYGSTSYKLVASGYRVATKEDIAQANAEEAQRKAIQKTAEDRQIEYLRQSRPELFKDAS